ncbi:MAG: hypothetical protein JWM93_482 [Frankiales bacterium]|nr:hypothetical protein [Frankiales bacterium]
MSAVKALRALGFPAVRVRAMRRRGVARDSVALSAEERATNAGGAFVVRRSAVRRLRDTDVIVVDDIVTTGATCVAVSATLRAAGARVAAVAAVAATQRRVLVNAGE